MVLWPDSVRIGLENLIEKERTAVKRPYQIIEKRNRKELVRFLVKNGQALLPMVELIEESRMAVDELIDVVGRAQIEAAVAM